MYEGESVILRPVDASDEPLLLEWDNDDELNLLMGTDVLVDLKDHFSLCDGRSCIRLMIETKAGAVIGNVDLIRIHWRRKEAELVARIGRKDYWNQGYGSDAVISSASGILQVRAKSVYLRVYRSNKRAVRCYESAGFEKKA